jgi:hypothetical protein
VTRDGGIAATILSTSAFMRINADDFGIDQQSIF